MLCSSRFIQENVCLLATKIFCESLSVAIEQSYALLFGIVVPKLKQHPTIFGVSEQRTSMLERSCGPKSARD